MNANQKQPTTEDLLNERAELLKAADQYQQQILLAHQRVAFLNGVLTERGVDLTAQLTDQDQNTTPSKATANK